MYSVVMRTFFVSVNENNAQIPVTVTFDPPSPVPPGVTIFRCDFDIGKLNQFIPRSGVKFCS